MEFRIADTFTDSLARLIGDEQKAVKTTAFDLLDAPFNRVEPPTANEQNRRCTERLENCRVINDRVGLRLLPVPQDILRKCGGSAPEKRFKISRLRVPY
jgi:hypothetical protein